MFLFFLGYKCTYFIRPFISKSVIFGLVLVMTVTTLCMRLVCSWSVLTSATIFADLPGKIGFLGAAATVQEQDGRTSPKTKGCSPVFSTSKTAFTTSPFMTVPAWWTVLLNCMVVSAPTSTVVLSLQAANRTSAKKMQTVFIYLV